MTHKTAHRALEEQLASTPTSLYRRGDICEAAIISAHNLPGSAELETTVMLSLDSRHQVPPRCYFSSACMRMRHFVPENVDVAAIEMSLLVACVFIHL